MLPEEGKICEIQPLPWQEVSANYHILYHIPLEELKVDCL